MCGRYTLGVPADLVAEVFDAHLASSHKPRWNIAPTELGAVVRLGKNARRELVDLQWGFRPFWDRGGAGKPMINARAETVAEKPAFKSAFARRRCLVPADGFYEWRDERFGSKTVRSPLHFRQRDRGLFAMAGLWSPGGERDAYTIVTTTPNALVEPFHDRMPAILAPEFWAAWLDPEAPAEYLSTLVGPYPAELMEAAPASRAVNRAGVEGPELLHEDGPGPLFM